jgi:hypothetical protein
VLAREEAIAPGTYPGGYFRLFFSDSLQLKAWFATAALSLATLQLLSAAWVFRKLPWSGQTGSGVSPLDRAARFRAHAAGCVHCIFKLGFQRTNGRVLAHSFLGCAFYGAFATKVVIVRLHRFPSWALAIAGGVLFAVLLATWYLSALWLFRARGIRL